MHRTWDVAQHPQWLVFEAEGQLQIRPAQHWIANHLIENPGAITQLNMGEGKTRVILPMLVLHWADGSKVVSQMWIPPHEPNQHLALVLNSAKQKPWSVACST